MESKMDVWQASAPSNIALIKYMGKVDKENNHPANSSLSYTLEHLRTFVQLEKSSQDQDTWQPLEEAPLELSDKGKKRYLAHLQFLKDKYNYKKIFVVKSKNNFPSDCGLASSASSFAALTLAFYKALKEESGVETPLAEKIECSRKGSGSSCRSFFNSWVQWDEQGVKQVSNIGYDDLSHLCIVVNRDKKTISSSEAHQRVLQSALFHSRADRAEQRLKELKDALIQKDWAWAYQISWAEFWDMHSLFETSQPPFGYMTSESLKVLTSLRNHWQHNHDGPLVTMDAGANVHLLFRKDQGNQINSIKDSFTRNFALIDSRDFNGYV